MKKILSFLCLLCFTAAASGQDNDVLPRAIALYQKKVYNLLKQPSAEFVELPSVSETVHVAPVDTPVARIIMIGMTVEFCNGIDCNTVSSIIR